MENEPQKSFWQRVTVGDVLKAATFAALAVSYAVHSEGRITRLEDAAALQIVVNGEIKHDIRQARDEFRVDLRDLRTAVERGNVNRGRGG